MFRKVFGMLARLVILITILSPLLVVLPSLLITLRTRRLIYGRAEDIPGKRVAIVLGAGLWRDGSPTPVLRDRVATAADLYIAGKVEKLLMSGDNRSAHYNEPAAMRDFALQLGVPDSAIVLDYAGRRTYDTCYRARHIFRVREAILVTQIFHLPRAIYTCNALGVSAVGISADRRTYSGRSSFYWSLREVPATAIAMWEVHVSHPLPVLGNPEPIFPLEAQ